MSDVDDIPAAHRGRYVPSERYERVTLAQIAREIHRTRPQTLKLLAKLAFVGARAKKGRSSITYPAEAVNLVKGLVGIPHRDPDHHHDWLSQHLTKETR